MYRTHGDILRRLNPTVIITQDYGEVYAVGLKDVEQITCNELKTEPAIVSLAPSSRDSIFEGMIVIASQLGDASRGKKLVDSIERRIEQVARVVSSLGFPKQRVACIEWVEPLMVAGNWMPERVELLGAIDVLGPKTIHSATIDFGQLSELDPDTIIACFVDGELKRLAKSWNQC